MPPPSTGLIAWYKADADTYKNTACTTPATADGDSVAGWKDQSGNGHDVIQSNGARLPVLKLSIVNSMPVLRFDSASFQNLVTSGTVAHGIGTGDFWLAAVVGTPATPLTWGPAFGQDLANGMLYVASSSSATKVGGSLAYATQHAFNYTIAGSKWYLLEMFRVSGTLKLYRSEIGILPSLDANTFSDTTSLATHTFYVGTDDEGDYFKGDIAEILFYSAALNSTDQSTLELYLTGKYAAPSTPTTATLSGSTGPYIGVATTYTITLDLPAGVGGVSCPVSCSNGAWTVTPSTVTIPQWQTIGTFTVKPNAAATANVILSATTPSLTLAGTPISATSTAAPATAYTTVGDGNNWSAGASWTPTAPDGGPSATRADTCTIAHNTTVDTNSSVGAAGATGTYALAFSASATGKSLTIADNATLDLYGGFDQKSSASGSSFVILGTSAGGAHIVFHPGSTIQYDWKCSYGANIVANGISGNHCSISTTGAGLNTYIWNSTLESTAGLVTSTYLDVTNMGDSTHAGIQTWIGATRSGSATDISLTHGTFTGSSYRWYGVDTWDHNFTFSDNHFASSVPIATYGSAGFAPGRAASTGTWTVARNYFDSTAINIGVTNIHWQHNISLGGFTCSGTIYAPWAQFDSNVQAAPNGYKSLGGNSITNFYFYNTNGTSNPEGFNFQELGVDITVDGCILECPLNTGAGDMILPPANVAAPKNFTIQRCITVSSATGVGCGGLLSASPIATGAQTVMHINHNTINVEGSDIGGISYGNHGTQPWAGEMASVRANLSYGASGVLLGEILDSGTDTTDSITVAGHNGVYTNQTGTITCNGVDYTIQGYEAIAGAGRKILISSAGPLPNAQIGQGDVNTDPALADTTRNLCTWGQKVANVNGDGTLPTYSATLAWIFTNGASTYIPAMMAWVRDGHASSNTDYKAASYATDPLTVDANGNAWAGGATADIGAMAYVLLAVTENTAGTKGDATAAGQGCAINVYLGRTN